MKFEFRKKIIIPGFFLKKLSGRAIFLAIIISFVSAILAFLFILSRYYGFVEITNLNGYKQLTDNVASALNIIMQQPDAVDFNEETTLSLYEDSSSNVLLKKLRWGIYEIAQAKSQWKNYTVEKSVLFGQNTAGKDAIGLYLTDHGHYLAVAGDTYLSGRCFLPKLGARKAYIDGKSFKYPSIVDGSIHTSSEKLPAIAEDFLNYLENELFDSPLITDSLISENELNSEELVNSFWRITQRIHSKDIIELSNINITGNYIIQSDKEISITEDCILQYVICIAPKIQVEKGFEGSVQLFAQDSLLIDKEVSLKYPSAAVVAGFGRSVAYADILPGSKIEGTILLFAELTDNSDVIFKINPYAEIFGTVYCAGKVDIRGKVFGSLYCDRFFLQTQQGYYENHLLDAWIDPEGLEPAFASGIFMDDSGDNVSNQYIVWLD